MLRSSHLQEIVRKAQEEDAKVLTPCSSLATVLTAGVHHAPGERDSIY